MDRWKGRASAGNTISQYKKGIKRAEQFLAGEFKGNNLALEVNEIAVWLDPTAFNPVLAAEAFESLVAAIRETKEAVARKAGQPVGPTVEVPPPKAEIEGGGHSITTWDVGNFSPGGR